MTAEIDGKTYPITNRYVTALGREIALATLEDGSQRTVSRRPGGAWAWDHYQ